MDVYLTCLPSAGDSVLQNISEEFAVVSVSREGKFASATLRPAAEGNVETRCDVPSLPGANDLRVRMMTPPRQKRGRPLGLRNRARQGTTKTASVHTVGMASMPGPCAGEVPARRGGGSCLRIVYPSQKRGSTSRRWDPSKGKIICEKVFRPVRYCVWNGTRR